jgi:hypothetical protein
MFFIGKPMLFIASFRTWGDPDAGLWLIGAVYRAPGNIDTARFRVEVGSALKAVDSATIGKLGNLEKFHRGTGAKRVQSCGVPG